MVITDVKEDIRNLLQLGAHLYYHNMITSTNLTIFPSYPAHHKNTGLVEIDPIIIVSKLVFLHSL